MEKTCPSCGAEQVAGESQSHFLPCPLIFKETKKISAREQIEAIIEAQTYSWTDPCGAINCDCYKNGRAIEAIIEYLDKN